MWNVYVLVAFYTLNSMLHWIQYADMLIISMVWWNTVIFVTWRFKCIDHRFNHRCVFVLVNFQNFVPMSIVSNAPVSLNTFNYSTNFRDAIKLISYNATLTFTVLESHRRCESVFEMVLCWCFSISRRSFLLADVSDVSALSSACLLGRGGDQPSLARSQTRHVLAPDNRDVTGRDGTKDWQKNMIVQYCWSILPPKYTGMFIMHIP